MSNRWLQSWVRRRGRRLDKTEERGKRQQWFLLAGASAEAQRGNPEPGKLTPIYPPETTFWADPFVWTRDGRHYIFFEDFPYATWRGLISVIEIDAQGKPLGPAQTVLEEPYHLSYPYLFEYGGELYMVPEKTEVKRIDLYRCVRFPDQWVFERTLMDGIKAADSTLFEHEGRWWLFCAAKQGRVRINESLFAFHADSPLSTEWTPHRANPLVHDFSRGRPAGRIFRDVNGQLLRPSQDCVRRYGHGLRLSRIEELTPSTYRETTVWHQSGDAAGGWRAMHHVDWKDGIMVMDAQRLLDLAPAQESAP